MKLTTPSSVDLKNEWIYASAPPYILMACTVANLHLDPFTLFVFLLRKACFVPWRRKKCYFIRDLHVMLGSFCINKNHAN